MNLNRHSLRMIDCDLAVRFLATRASMLCGRISPAEAHQRGIDRQSIRKSCVLSYQLSCASLFCRRFSSFVIVNLLLTLRESCSNTADYLPSTNSRTELTSNILSAWS